MNKHLTKVLTARIPEEIFLNLNEIAETRNRKRGDIIREALELYLENWADYQIAIDRLKDSSDKIQTEQEFLNELGWAI
jgi:predicted DNA-binding protein